MMVYYSPELVMYIVPVIKFSRVWVVHEPAMAKVARKRRPLYPTQNTRA